MTDTAERFDSCMQVGGYHRGQHSLPTPSVLETDGGAGMDGGGSALSPAGGQEGGRLGAPSCSL